MKSSSTQWLKGGACAVLAISAGMLMIGCESQYDLASRHSCLWNHDINLKGCDRWSFSRCIDNCEFCVGARGTQFEGKSDECNQLKCAAYCAKQDADPRCLSTYSFMCEGGKKAFEKHHSQTCDVDCNAAPRAQPQFVAMASMVFLAFSKLPTKALLAVGILVICVHLQGCEDDPRFRENGGCSSSFGSLSSSSGCAKMCEPQKPLLPDWEPDFKRMDEKAGCNDHWSWWSGNPCASDVPVIFAKKGIYQGTDPEHIIAGVEIEKYNCTKRVDDYCAEWTTFEKSCQEEDFGVCTCTKAFVDESGRGRYCDAWTCVTKEAEQNLCWEGCCGKDCSPCVKCGAWGSAPFPMDREKFDELMAGDGIISNITKAADSDSHALHLDSDVDSLVGQLRRSYWGIFWYGPTCIASRDITNTYSIPCSNWREIETEIQTCRCLRPDDGQNYCSEWKCEEKDVGQFSILFESEESYEELIEGQEVEKYTCTNKVTSASGAEKCSGWRGDIESREEVEVVQCRGCENLTVPHCQSWYCDEYEVPKILHEDIQWGRRIGFAFLHFLWMGGVVCFCATCCAGGLLEDSKGDSGVVVCVGVSCGAGCLALLLYAIAFLRWKPAQYWWAPHVPLVGLLLTFAASGLIAVCCFAIMPKGDMDGESQQGAMVGLLLIFWFGAMIIFGLGWVGGLAVVSPFIAVLLCMSCCLALGACVKSRKKDGNMRSNLMFDNGEESGEDMY